MADLVRVVITGGRKTEVSVYCMEEFLRLLKTLKVRELRHGANGNVDIGMSTLVRFQMPDIEVRSFPVDVFLDGQWPAAGCRRNGRMLKDSNGADVLVKFNGGRGTEDCLRQALRMGMEIWEWNERTTEFESRYNKLT